MLKLLNNGLHNKHKLNSNNKSNKLFNKILNNKLQITTTNNQATIITTAATLQKLLPKHGSLLMNQAVTTMLVTVNTSVLTN